MLMTVHFTCVESVFLCTSKFTLKVVGSCYENGLLDILYLCTLQESLRFSNLINSRLKFSTLRVFSNQNISDSTQSNRNTEGCMVCYDKRTLFTTNDKSWHQQPTKNNNKKHWIAFSGLRRRIPVRILRLCSRAIASLVGTMCFFFLFSCEISETVSARSCNHRHHHQWLLLLCCYLHFRFCYLRRETDSPAAAAARRVSMQQEARLSFILPARVMTFAIRACLLNRLPFGPGLSPIDHPIPYRPDYCFSFVGMLTFKFLGGTWLRLPFQRQFTTQWRLQAFWR